MFFDRLKLLCDQKGISAYKACTDVGLNRAAVAKWKKGSQPNGATALKLAEYFDVSVDELLGKQLSKSSGNLFCDTTGYWDGSRLRDQRNSRGHSVKDFSERLGISEDEYKNLESGITEPSFELLLRLADAFSYDLDYLCHRTSKLDSDLHANKESRVLSPRELDLIHSFRSLNPDGQQKVLDYTADLSASGRYIKTAAISTPKQA